MSRNTSQTKHKSLPPPPPPLKPKQYEIRPTPPGSVAYGIPGPGFLGSMVQGFGLGMGSSMGHRATDAMFGSSSCHVEQPTKNETNLEKIEPISKFAAAESDKPNCDDLLIKYRDCMSHNFLDCDKIYDEYFQCIKYK